VKALLRVLERARRHFSEGGRLRRAKPVFQATEHFFFAAGTRTARAPHVRDPLDVKRFMVVVIIALAPCVLASLRLFGLRVLAMIAVSYAAGGAIEVLFAVVRKEEINEGFLVTGLLFPMILPPALPLWMVAVGVAFGVVVGKEIFGGTGRNLFNPAIVGRCFLALAYPVSVSANWIKPGGGLLGRVAQYADASNVDVITAATPLVSAKQGSWASMSDLFFGQVAGCVGETSALAILLGGTFLLLTRVANWRTVAGTVGGFLLLGSVLHYLQPARFGPAVWHVFAGGLLFGAFFMATDPVTSPVTNAGKWVYGALIGAVTVLIRNLTGYVEGVMFAILLGNICAPILDEIVVAVRLRRLPR
jgi:Na(+)-translocating NADH:ubiquinone oxidoreductase B subunit